MSKKHVKPTGDIGQIKIYGNGQILFDKVKFPETKEEIEKQIMLSFVEKEKKQKILPFNIQGFVQNEIDDFDFTLKTYEKKYFELQEIAPLDFYGVNYKNAPSYYKDYDFARYVYNKIIDKNNSYSVDNEIGIYLLTYITDWKFVVSDTAISLLQYWLSKQEIIFKGVYLASYLDKDSLIRSVIYPVDKNYFLDFNEEKYKENSTYLLDPNKWKITTN